MLFFTLTFTSAPTEFSQTELGIIVCIFAGVLAVELLIARFITRYRFVQNMVLAVFTTINILYVNLILNDVFMDLPNYARGLALLLAIFILYTFMKIVDENPKFSKAFLAFIALVTASILTPTLFSTAPAPKAATEHGKTSATNIRIVGFESKPNVYFISFDSLIPKVLLQKYMGLESTPYHDVLDGNFRRFKNFFADRIQTKRSLNSLLAFDIEHFSDAVRNDSAYNYFSGLTPSPLLEIFKYNGYETTTSYKSRYFGPKKGPHVDNYLYKIDGRSLRDGGCEFVDTWGLRAPTFMGYCYFVQSEKLWTYLQSWGVTTSPDIDPSDFIIGNARDRLKKGVPQFFLGYIFSPGHTNQKGYKNSAEELKEFKKNYLKHSKNTAYHLNKILSFLAKEDPNAIVYLFGDHGPILTRGGTFESDPDFYIQDRYGVYGGIYPPDRCANSFSKPYNKEFMTILQGAHMIVRCLSGGKNAFIKQTDYRLPEIENKDNIRYEDYLYE